jgi:predicted enzyme related to lactoylglutathione lyase
MHGNFFWYDVMTRDTGAAAKFYGAVVGWDTQAQANPGVDYTVFTTQGRGVAGLMPIPPHMPPDSRSVWLGYIYVDDVDAACARITAEGGAVMRAPTDVPGVIRFAVVADPQGAAFLVARPMPTDAPLPLPPGTPGTIGWHELYAGEWSSVFGFYEKLFGWTKSTPVDMGPMGTYQLFAKDGVDIGGMMTKPPAVPHPYWGYYFNVAAIDAAAARATAAGGTILNGPMEVPGPMWVVQALDDQGAVFALVAPIR